METEKSLDAMVKDAQVKPAAVDVQYSPPNVYSGETHDPELDYLRWRTEDWEP